MQRGITGSEHFLHYSKKCYLRDCKFKLFPTGNFSPGLFALVALGSKCADSQGENVDFQSTFIKPPTVTQCRHWIVTQHAGPSGPSPPLSPSSERPPPSYRSISLSLYHQNTAHHILIMPPEQKTLFQLMELPSQCGVAP